VLGATTGAELRLIESDPEADPAVVGAIQARASARVNRSWERLGTLGQGGHRLTAVPAPAHRRGVRRVLF
jgi:hypothetical protein